MIFDAIKIDGSLIAGAAESEAGERLLKGVLDLCASLRVPCVAEHIERPEQLDMLRALAAATARASRSRRRLPAEEARALAARQAGALPAGTRRGAQPNAA